jgi:hypothetical protein
MDAQMSALFMLPSKAATDLTSELKLPSLSGVCCHTELGAVC